MAVAAVLAMAPARAAVVYTGCGSDFAIGCSLQELVDGGTIQVDDTLFWDWALFENDTDTGGDPPDLTVIQVTGLDDQPNAPGLKYQTTAEWTAANPPDGGGPWTYFDFAVEHTGSGITGMSLSLTGYTLEGEGFLSKSAWTDADPCGCGPVVGAINFAGDEFDEPFSEVFLYDAIHFGPVWSMLVENDVDLFVPSATDTAGIFSFEERFLVPAPALGVFGLIAALAFARRRA